MKTEIQKLSYCNKALEIKNDLECRFILLGEYLYNIKEHSLFEPQWSSFQEFCMELKMSTNTINKLMQVYKVFVLNYNIPMDTLATAGGFSLIADTLPAIHSREDAMEWLGKTTVLTREDMRKELKEKKTGILMSECKHSNTYTVTVCRDCGETKQIL